MKKKIIGTLVAGVILFIWQFLSWSLLNLHGAEMQYSPNQNTVLTALAENLEEGSYFLPQPAAGTSEADADAEMKEMYGKPWATIHFHNSMQDNMSMNMIRGLVTDLVAAFLLVWLLMQFKEIDFLKAIMASVAVGLIGYFVIPYLNHIWFETPSWGYLIDSVVQWGLVGAWLGIWLPR